MSVEGYKPGVCRPTWFLIIASVHECLYVHVRVCVSTLRLLVTIGVMRCDQPHMIS